MLARLHGTTGGGPTALRDLLTELRRRKIWWVAGVYLATAWVIFQVVVLLEGTFSLPAWMDMVVVIILAMGLPLAIILAWAQETQAAGEAVSEDEGLQPEDAATTPKGRKADPPSIAVLPFENISDDRNQEYLADGMTEELINLLSHAPRLRVTARSATAHFKRQEFDIRDIGRDLNVRYVVEGSVRPVGSRIRVTARLVETQDASQLWSDRFDRPTEEIFEIQDEVVEAIYRQLYRRLEISERDRVRGKKPENLDAWGLLMQAIQISLTDRASQNKRRTLVQQALRLEPDYPLANAYLANFLAEDCTFGFSKQPTEDKAAAKQYAEKALLDAPDDPNILLCCCSVFHRLEDVERRSEVIERHFKLTRVPTTWLYMSLSRSGRRDEADEVAERLLEELTGDNLGSMHHLLGQEWTVRGDLENALHHELLARSLAPANTTILTVLANIYGSLGRMEEAREVWDDARKRVPKLNRDDVIAAINVVWKGENEVHEMTRGIIEAGLE